MSDRTPREHVFVVTIKPDEGMGLDNPKTVRGLIEEAIRDSGMDNGCDVKVRHQATQDASGMWVPAD